MNPATIKQARTSTRVDQLLEAARQAPSPDNNQPWTFRPGDRAIDVLHRRDRALPSDARDLFSWIALGAAIENISLAASRQGRAANVDYRPRPFETTEDGEHVATVRLEGDSDPDPLAELIEERVTNRRLYGREPLPDRVLAILAQAVRRPQERCFWLTGRASLKRLSKLVLAADRIRFEHRPFHEEFHKVLRYGPEEARRTGDGLEIKSLEIPSAAGPIMRWLSPWRRMRLANRLGMSRMFAGNSAKQVVHSGAVGWLTTEEPSDRGYLEAGRSLQRIWLAATREGLAFQPLGGLPLFLTKLEAEGRTAFLPEHASRLEGLQAAFYDLVPDAAGRAPAMLFRVGRAAAAPSARSYRYSMDRICVEPRTGK